MHSLLQHSDSRYLLHNHTRTSDVTPTLGRTRFKGKDEKLVVDVVMRGDTSYILVCACRSKDYDEFKGTFSAVLQSLTFK
jgi:hypothetical protein